MADTDIRETDTTNLNTTDIEYSVDSQVLDDAETNEFFYHNDRFTKYLGYYKTIPELKKSVDAIAMWTVGRGWNTNIPTKVLLQNINGYGTDTFQNIMWNMIVMKKVNGDAYAEQIRDKIAGIEGDSLVNLKPLNPQKTRIVYNRAGMIIRYEHQQSEHVWRKIKKENMFHIANDRVGSEIHGTSVVEAVQWVIDARNEAMVDVRRMSHRQTVRIIEVDMDDTTTVTNLKRDWRDSIEKGDVLLLPKGSADIPNVPVISTAEHREWIRYLENFFYQAVGVPKIILGGSQEFTEASSKIGYLTFEQPYMTEQRDIEEDIWNQLGIKIKFERPISLKSDIQESEEANTGQVGIQDNETEAGSGE